MAFDVIINMDREDRLLGHAVDRHRCTVFLRDLNADNRCFDLTE